MTAQRHRVREPRGARAGSSRTRRVRARGRATASTHGRRVLALWMLTGALTALGGLLGLVAPRIAPGGVPQPTLNGTITEAASIFVHNLRVLAGPLILAAARWGHGRTTRAIGDVVVGATVLVSPLLVGATLARHGRSLLAYLPHVPVEWAALSVAAGAWIAARPERLSTRTLAAYVTTTVALAALAAVIETLSIPHAT